MVTFEVIKKNTFKNLLNESAVVENMATRDVRSYFISKEAEHVQSSNSSGITEAIENVNDKVEKVENPFKEV